MIEGDTAPLGAIVVIKNVVTNETCATAIADFQVKWRFGSRAYNAGAAPCVVKAGSGGSFGPAKAAENAPGHCL